MHNHTQVWIRRFRTALVTEIKALLPGLVSQAYYLSYSGGRGLPELQRKFKTSLSNLVKTGLWL